MIGTLSRSPRWFRSAPPEIRARSRTASTPGWTPRSQPEASRWPRLRDYPHVRSVW
jgi:hypothetical protein